MLRTVSPIPPPSKAKNLSENPKHPKESEAGEAVEKMPSVDELVEIIRGRIEDTDLEFYLDKPPKLKYAVNYAISQVNNRCGHRASDKAPYPQKYEMNILDGAVWYLAKIGAEGYSSTSENGVSVSWKDIPAWLLGVSGGVFVC